MRHTIRVIWVSGFILFVIKIFDPNFMTSTLPEIWSESAVIGALILIAVATKGVWSLPTRGLPLPDMSSSSAVHDINLSRQGPPLFEDVGVRATAVIVAIILGYQVVVVHTLGLAGIPLNIGLVELVNSWPKISVALAASSLVVSVLGGAFRHFNGLTLSYAYAICTTHPSKSSGERSKMMYVGWALHPKWMWMPLFRVSSWVIVTLTSFLGAMIITVTFHGLFATSDDEAVMRILFLRWLKSVILAHLLLVCLDSSVRKHRKAHS